MDPHQIERYDSDPHQRDKRDPNLDPHQFADDKPKCMEYRMSLLEDFFQVLCLYFEARSGSGSAEK
jgi:hypothetical protein